MKPGKKPRRGWHSSYLHSVAWTAALITHFLQPGMLSNSSSSEPGLRHRAGARDVPNSRFIGKNCRMGIFGVGIGTLRQHFVQCRLSISGDSTSFYPISGVTIQINVREENFLSLKTRIARRRRKNFYDQHSSRLLGISLEYF